MNHQRMILMMNCFDRLPPHLREWIANLHFSLHDDHILRGADDVAGAKAFIDNGGIEHCEKGNGQN